MHPAEPFGKFCSIPERGGKAEQLEEGIETPDAHESTLEPRAAPPLPEEMQLINHHEADVRDPSPVCAPLSCAGVEAFRSHDEHSRLLERDGIGFALPVFTSEYPDFVTGEAVAPSLDELVGECSQRSEVNRARARLERRLNSLFGEPGFPRSCRHLEDTVESAVQQTSGDDLFLGRVELEGRCRKLHPTTFSSSELKRNRNMH